MIASEKLAFEYSIIKMDIEGAEPFALEGMKASLEKFRPKIVMELNRPALAQFDATPQIFGIFSEAGHTSF